MMQYIDNQDLREWVKKSLRKTIILKAHELAMQTGCEVLLKIRDETISDGNFYYATESLQEEYNSKGLSKQSDELCVSGETGLPVYPKVSIATQSDKVAEKSAKEQTENGSNSESNSESQDRDSILPLHLTVTDEDDVEELTEPKVKMEVLDEAECETDNSMEIPSLLDDDNNDLAAAFGMEDMDNPSTLQVYTPIAPKLYQCAVCQKAFRSVQVLQKHTQTFHQRSNPTGLLTKGITKGRGPTGRIAAAGRPIAPKRHSCTVCSRSFPNLTLLNDHMSRSHMMASAGFQQASMDSEFNVDDSEGGGSNSDPPLPKISQVMSLQGSMMQISTSSDTSFTMGSPATSPVFQTAGPSTSGAGRSSGISVKMFTKTSTPATREETMDQGFGVIGSDSNGGGASSSRVKLGSGATKGSGSSSAGIQVNNVVWEEVMSRRNGKGYKIGDYIYQKDRTSPKGIWYLRCKRRKKLACKGRAIVSGENGKNEVKIMGEHNHEPETTADDTFNYALK